MIIKNNEHTGQLLVVKCIVAHRPPNRNLAVIKSKLFKTNNAGSVVYSSTSTSAATAVYRALVAEVENAPDARSH